MQLGHGVEETLAYFTKGRRLLKAADQGKQIVGARVKDFREKITFDICESE